MGVVAVLPLHLSVAAVGSVPGVITPHLMPSFCMCTMVRLLSLRHGHVGLMRCVFSTSWGHLTSMRCLRIRCWLVPFVPRMGMMPVVGALAGLVVKHLRLVDPVVPCAMLRVLPSVVISVVHD